MTTLVVDSSIVPKWFFAEVHGAEAERIRAGNFDLVAPRFLLIELANIAVQKVRRGIVPEAAGEELVANFQALPLDLVDDRPHLYEAYRLARAYHPSVYDCLYAAVALHLGGQCVTADRRFYNAFAPAFPETMLWVEDIPA